MKIKSLIRYSWAVIGFILVSIFFFIIPLMLDRLHPILMAIGGLLFSPFVRYTWHIFMQPVLEIKRETELMILLLGDRKQWAYEVNRIMVENVGRSAAKNCKGWIVTEKSKERVCWTVPEERPNATINAKDSEGLDFCAYLKKGPKDYRRVFTAGKPEEVPTVISPTEEDWPTDPFDARNISSLTECKVLVTFSNAEPVEAEIVFKKHKVKVLPYIQRFFRFTLKI